MRKLGLSTGMIVAVAALLFSMSVNAHASAKDEKAIEDIEHKMIAATNTNDLMKYYDQNDVDVYDLAGPLQYKGNPLFVATLTTSSLNLRVPKEISSSWWW
jgi:hypothetical protein